MSFDFIRMLRHLKRIRTLMRLHQNERTLLHRNCNKIIIFLMTRFVVTICSEHIATDYKLYQSLKNTVRLYPHIVGIMAENATSKIGCLRSNIATR